MRYENYLNSYLIGQPTKVEPLSLPDQSLKRKCVECVTLKSETRGRVEWTQKYRHDETGNW